jgi:hypothetical protein
MPKIKKTSRREYVKHLLRQLMAGRNQFSEFGCFPSLLKPTLSGHELPTEGPQQCPLGRLQMGDPGYFHSQIVTPDGYSSS